MYRAKHAHNRSSVHVSLHLDLGRRDSTYLLFLSHTAGLLTFLTDHELAKTPYVFTMWLGLYNPHGFMKLA